MGRRGEGEWIDSLEVRIEYCGVVHAIGGVVSLFSPPGLYSAMWTSPRNVGHADGFLSADDARRAVMQELRASYGQHGEALTDAVWKSRKAAETESLESTTPTAGVKHDGGRLRWNLLPLRALESCVRVLEHGAAKYSPGNWRFVANGEERYFEALMRHVADYQAGVRTDPESGLPTIGHILANAIFLAGLEIGMGKAGK